MENKSHFFAMVSRMKLIDRWALMRNTQNENVSEHTMEVAAVAHALAVIKNKKFGGNLNCERACLLALYHDMPEILTGDLPTPVKYRNDNIRDVYREIESSACRTLVDMLPEEMKEDYESCFFPRNEDEYLWKIVKAADKISALIKCIEEKKAGNTEFDFAAQASEKAIEKMNMPEVKYFMDTFLDSYSLTLDQQNL